MSHSDRPTGRRTVIFIFVTLVAIFILLYFPCVATVGAIYKEAGPGWAWFSCGWSLVLGYTTAVIVYQCGQLTNNFGSAAGWISAMVISAAIFYTALIRYARKQTQKSGLIPVVEL